MCLSIPAQIIEINGDQAKVSGEGIEYNISIMLLEDPQPGDYILVHAGFALQKISEEEAAENLRILKELNENPDEI